MPKPRPPRPGSASCTAASYQSNVPVLLWPRHVISSSPARYVAAPRLPDGPPARPRSAGASAQARPRRVGAGWPPAAPLGVSSIAGESSSVVEPVSVRHHVLHRLDRLLQRAYLQQGRACACARAGQPRGTGRGATSAGSFATRDARVRAPGSSAATGSGASSRQPSYGAQVPAGG